MTKQLRTRSLALAVSVLTCALVSVPVFAQLDTDEQRAGYGMGVNIGSTLAGQGLLQDLDLDAMIMGIRDSISGELQISEEEIMAALQTLQMKKQAEAEAEIAAQAQAGVAFLAQNGERSGVTTTASGLQYEVITSGSGGAKPKETDTVNVHYHGTLMDGTVFDSSVERNEPISFPLNGVIPGWTEGLQLMGVGDKYRFFIPSDLAYGDSGAGPIPPNSTLIFEVELLSIE